VLEFHGVRYAGSAWKWQMGNSLAGFRGILAGVLDRLAGMMAIAMADSHLMRRGAGERSAGAMTVTGYDCEHHGGTLPCVSGNSYSRIIRQLNGLEEIKTERKKLY